MGTLATAAPMKKFRRSASSLNGASGDAGVLPEIGCSETARGTSDFWVEKLCDRCSEHDSAPDRITRDTTPHLNRFDDRKSIKLTFYVGHGKSSKRLNLQNTTI
jgi:hypothetical protein